MFQPYNIRLKHRASSVTAIGCELPRTVRIKGVTVIEDTATVPVDYDIVTGDGAPYMSAKINLASLGVDAKWFYDSVIGMGDGEITIMFNPPEDCSNQK